MDIDNIGKRILMIRQDTRFSQKKFAEFSNISYSYLAAVERGRVTPSFKFIVSMLNATKASADWLFTGKGSMYPEIKGETEEIKEINEDRGDYGVGNLPRDDDFKLYWDKLNGEQKKFLMGWAKEMAKEIVKNNNEILREENRMLKDLIIKIATKTQGERPSNVVQGLTD
jgi:transcriptional regulator with XRE-family HTH domain